MDLESYIKTKEWRQKRIETFLKKWKKCMKCGSEKQIQVHHSTYTRLWNENISTDLFPLCKRCHEFFHKHYKWHFIKNTLEFISVKELPKYESSIKVRRLPPMGEFKKTRKRKRFKVNSKPKKPKPNKYKFTKEPFIPNVYAKTQGKKLKEFKLF